LDVGLVLDLEWVVELGDVFGEWFGCMIGCEFDVVVVYVDVFV